jgi:hypothetical protein
MVNTRVTVNTPEMVNTRLVSRASLFRANLFRRKSVSD